MDAAAPINKFTTSIIDHYLILANLFIDAAPTSAGLEEDYVIIIIL